MLEAPIKDLKKARILCTNDDGIHAPGLKALEQIARTLSDDVWVCAPETEQSAVAHSLTIHRPLRIRHISERRYAVDGGPTDCVLLAVEQILIEHKPDLVLSGVNRGGNGARGCVVGRAAPCLSGDVRCTRRGNARTVQRTPGAMRLDRSRG